MLSDSRILIVEDDPDAATELAGILRDFGYAVAGTTDSGEQALRLAGTVRPDLVLMHVRLRGRMDGIQAAEVIHDIWKIPVIFISASSDGETIERAKAAAPLGYVTRPFQRDELNASIRMALHQRRLTESLFTEHGWFSTMLHGLTDGVIATDAQGYVTYLNPSAERLTRWQLTEAAGKPIEEIFAHAAELRGLHRSCSLRRALTRLRPAAESAFRLRRKDGSEVPVEDSASPIVHAGALLGAVTIFRDASERIRAEREQRRANRQLQQLVQLTGEELGQTREELRALSAHLLTAQDQERSRVARDLHDDFSQQTALMGLQLNAIVNSPVELDAKTREQLQTLAEQVEALSWSLRDFSHRLHPALLEDLGLAAALEAMAAEWRQRGMDLSLALQGTPPALPPEIATALYRIAQEALSNAARHAPGAPVLMTATLEENELVLRIDDAGPGFRSGKRGSGIGLLNMRERARLVGGTFTLTAEPERGTSITVSVPLKQATPVSDTELLEAPQR